MIYISKGFVIKNYFHKHMLWYNLHKPRCYEIFIKKSYIQHFLKYNVLVLSIHIIKINQQRKKFERCN